MRDTTMAFLGAAAAAVLTLGLPGAHAQQTDKIGHERHLHRHGRPHPAAPDPARFHTSRDGATLDLPGEEDAFFFVVYGDRTGGPDEGVAVLADAVRDTNLLEPDLVMTVGDLVQGYNRTPEWMDQMREFKGIMDELLCPWFPVAGNHDVYWRGPDKPEGEHEDSYEMHFGPLWYAFEHKDCWFIALYTDEGNPETGEKDFNKPDAQRMSPEQLAWLEETLDKAAGADHVFVFLHHPRWLGGNYGDDWERVHELLVSAGNVSAVFAGHIHRMRYDPRDGIEYVTLATVGGGQSERVPEAGWLHHFNVVTVREDQIAMSSIPVGEVMDVREITGELAADAARLAGVRPEVGAPIVVRADGAASASVSATVANPTGREVEATLLLDTSDARWGFWPDHLHQVLAPGETAELTFHADRMADSLDPAFRLPEMRLAMDMLAPGHRYSIPESATPLPVEARLEAPAVPAAEMALQLDGERACLRVPSAEIPVPDGPITLECWLRADSFASRTGLLAKTENSEYAIFVNDGRPTFSVHLDGRYVEAGPDEPVLRTGRWHHVAGVFDASQVRMYVDGRLVGTTDARGKRTTNDFPLFIGADVDRRGEPMSHFDGLIDGVRLSTTARYAGDRFDPARRPEADDRTVLLLNMDATVGPWLYDASGHGAHATMVGPARVVEADR